MAVVSLRIAPMMLHSIDRNGLITEVSDLWLAKLGYALDDVIGKRSTDFLSDDSARYAREVVLPSFYTDGSCDVEYEMKCKDGSLLPVRLHGVAVRDEHGEFVRSIAVSEDLTERRELERKMFEIQKLDSLGVMAGNIAHDFSNLLSVVIGGAQLAARHLDARSPAHTAIDNVLLAAARAADLCKELLAYSGRGKFEIATVELDALVAELPHMLEIPIGERAEVVLDLAHDGACVDVDATQIRQVLMNLVLNAADAMGDVPGTIRIRTERVELDQAAILASLRPEARPGAYASISVTDDGCGMTPDVRARVFEPFFTTKPTGRGLGLAATLGIVHGHRGTLTVDSEPGRGTCFTVFLPISEAPARATPEPPTTRPHGGARSGDDNERMHAAPRRSTRPTAQPINRVADRTRRRS